MNAIKIFLWAHANMFSFKIFYKTILLSKKGEVLDLFLGKITYVIKKLIKNYIEHTVIVNFIFHIFVEL